MNILVYTNLFPDSVRPNHGIFTLKRMGILNNSGDCRIKVVAPVPYCPPWPFLGKKWYQYSQIKKREEIEGIEVYHPRYLLFPKISMLLHGLLMFLGSYFTVRKIYREFVFDIIDAHFIYPDGFAAMLLSKTMKKPLSVSALGSDIHEFTKYRIIRDMIYLTLKNADVVISVCQALKSDIIKMGIQDSKIHVIPSGVDINRFYPIDKNNARTKLGLPKNGNIILSVGSLIPLKGFQTIIAALPNILKKHPETYLYIIGKGQYKKDLINLIDQFDLKNHVVLVGQRPNHELPFWYNAADIFCLASFREGWPNVVMEAIACGTPVVATKVFGIPEIINSSDLGILVKPDKNSVKDGLMEAINTIWDRKKISSFTNNRTWFHISEKIQTLFVNVINLKSNKEGQ